jgi:hypothetical protein
MSIREAQMFQPLVALGQVRRTELIQEAENQRLARIAVSHRQRRHLRPLARLGSLLVIIGRYLQSDHKLLDHHEEVAYSASVSYAKWIQ